MNRNRTPLRYPGGKQRLAPFILEILEANDLVGGHYAEPYAGGAGVAMELLLAGAVSHVHLNDSSVPVYAFWRSILKETDSFCRRIANIPLTIEEWRRQREILMKPRGVSLLDRGFSLFYLNRCNRSGIPTAGVIGGVAQAGEWKMDARFPRKKLIARVESIAAKGSAITVKNWDAEKFIIKHIPRLPPESLVYCDPPYFHKASRLYLDHYKPDDHARIAAVIQGEMSRHWIVSYDSAPEILGFYGQRRSFLYDLQYSAAKVYKGREVFVFSDTLNMPARSSVLSVDVALKAIG